MDTPTAPMHRAPDSAPFFLSVALPAFLIGLAASGCASGAASVERAEIVPKDPAPSSDPEAEEMRALRARQLFVRGMTRAQTGDEGAALDLYAQALRMAPESPAILAASAELYALAGDRVTARYHLSKAHALAPDNIYYALHLAALHAEMGERAETARLYADVLEKAPRYLNARYDLARIYALEGLGDVYEALWDKQSATDAWRRALETAPNRLEPRRKIDRD